jgi:hypothetical protein
MANIPHQQAVIGGKVLSGTTATAGPDTLTPDERVVLVVQNNDAGAVTVTVTVPGNTRWGVAEPDVTSVSIPAGSLAAIGPFPRALADPADNLVDVTSSSTSVVFYAVRA